MRVRRHSIAEVLPGWEVEVLDLREQTIPELRVGRWSAAEELSALSGSLEHAPLPAVDEIHALVHRNHFPGLFWAVEAVRLGQSAEEVPVAIGRSEDMFGEHADAGGLDVFRGEHPCAQGAGQGGDHVTQGWDVTLGNLIDHLPAKFGVAVGAECQQSGDRARDWEGLGVCLDPGDQAIHDMDAIARHLVGSGSQHVFNGSAVSCFGVNVAREQRCFPGGGSHQ